MTDLSFCDHPASCSIESESPELRNDICIDCFRGTPLNQCYKLTYQDESSIFTDTEGLSSVEVEGTVKIISAYKFEKGNGYTHCVTVDEPNALDKSKLS